MLETETLSPPVPSPVDPYARVHLRLAEVLDRINTAGVLGPAELRELHDLTGEALALGDRRDCPHGLSNPAWCAVCTPGDRRPAIAPRAAL